MTLSYLDFVPTQRFQPMALALSPDARYVAYSSNLSGQFNLWVQPVAGGEARQLTSYQRHAVRDLIWSPDGESLVFTADHDGDEQSQIYRVTTGGGEPEKLSSAEGRQHALAACAFDRTGRYLVYSVNDRDPAMQDTIVRDLQDGMERRILPPPGVMFEPVGISPDGRWLLISGFRSHVDTDAFVVDLADLTGEPQEVTADTGEGFFEPVGWAQDSQGFLLKTNTWGGEFTSAGYFCLAEATVRAVARADRDIEHVAAGGDAVIWSAIEGRSALHGRRSGDKLALPQSLNAVITTMRLSYDGTLLALQVDAAERPMEIAVLDIATGTLRYLTDSRPKGLLAVRPVEPQTVTFPSREGRVISALQYRPHGHGPFPVLMWIHGGPHEQARPDYGRHGMFQYLAARGVLVLCPDMAGSTGYGTSFQKLIYRDWGGADLEDLGAAYTYLESLECADADFVAPAGGSYGGFATLSCLARLDHPWACGISLCGPSNLVTLATECPPTWRSFVDTVLGNPERDAEFLRSRSPITYADRITAPLFVIQGAMDPRVPQAESDQIVEKLRAKGNEVRYDIYPDEGHGFTNRANEIKAYSDMAEFLLTHLKRPDETQRLVGGSHQT